MDEIRIGIAGLGSRAMNCWILQLAKLPCYRITAIYDWIEPLHEAAISLIGHNDIKRFTNYEEFLAYSGMDAVALCVRQPEQGAMAAQALDAGKHVNAEVPAAHSIEDCWRIVLAAERSGKVYNLAEQTRYFGYVDAWRKLREEGSLGDIMLVEGQYLGWYGTQPFFQDFKTGIQYRGDELADHPEAKPTWLATMPPIHYLPHELSPLLKVLDDRVVQVVGMSTQGPSRSCEGVPVPDMQMALMKTEKGAIMRMAASFTCHTPEDDHHWHHIQGTRGRVEWRRSPNDRPKMWLSGYQMHHMADMDWRFERTDAPTEAAGSGHYDSDYYVHAQFRDQILKGKAPELDLYNAMNTAAPAILAGESIDRGSELLEAPDFRPNDQRPAGQGPKETV